VNNCKPGLVVICSWFLYSITIIWLSAKIYIHTHFITEWAFANLLEYEFPVLTLFLHLYDLIIRILLTLPFAIFAVKILPTKSFWPTLIISVCLVFLWEYRLPLTDYELFVTVFSFSQSYVAHFYVLFMLPIIAYIIRNIDSAKSI
jgi:hypothetical protein